MIIKNTKSDQSYKIYFNMNLKKYLNDFCEMIRENLNTRSELSEIWNLCINGTTPLFDKEDLEFIKIALEIIPNST